MLAQPERATLVDMSAYPPPAPRTTAAPHTSEQRSPAEARNRVMLRARDAMDRRYAEELDVRTLARSVEMSEAHFIRTFKEVFAETPHRYLQRRRVERAMYLLHELDRSVTDICFDVGFNSLGTFSRTFKSIVGCTPSSYRSGSSPVPVPTCFITSWTRPSSFGEAPEPARTYSDRTAGATGEAELEAAEEPR